MMTQTDTKLRHDAMIVWFALGDRGLSAAVMLPCQEKAPKRYLLSPVPDLFAPGLPLGAIDATFAVMALCRHHHFTLQTAHKAEAEAYIAEGFTPARILVQSLPYRGLVADPNRPREWGSITQDLDGVEYLDWPLKNLTLEDAE